MKCWDYINGVPWGSVKLIGKRKIWEWALVDTGASLYVLHPRFISVLGLEKIDERELSGFGSKKPIIADISIIEIEVDGFKEELEVACIREEYYPEKIPRIIIGRNFLNKYLITLNGEKACIEKKRARSLILKMSNFSFLS